MTLVVAGCGDSITAGIVGTIGSEVASPDDNWLGLASLLGGFCPINLGVPGAKASDWVTNFTRYTSHADFATTVPDAVSILLGINDIKNGSSAATTEASLISLIGLWRGVGVQRIYMGTPIPGGYTLAPAAFTGNTTLAGGTITSISTIAGLFPGMALTGTGLAAGTYIKTVDSPTQVSLNQNATANGTTVTITPAAPSSAYLTTVAQEQARQDLCQWIRYLPCGIAGVFDFDKVIAQQGNPGLADPQLISSYPHPDPSGYGRMASLVRIPS